MCFSEQSKLKLHPPTSCCWLLPVAWQGTWSISHRIQLRNQLQHDAQPITTQMRANNACADSSASVHVKVLYKLLLNKRPSQRSDLPAIHAHYACWELDVMLQQASLRLCLFANLSLKRPSISSPIYQWFWSKTRPRRSPHRLCLQNFLACTSVFFLVCTSLIVTSTTTTPITTTTNFQQTATSNTTTTAATATATATTTTTTDHGVVEGEGGQV